MSIQEDMIGKTFNRLKVIGIDEGRNLLELNMVKNGEKNRAGIYIICECSCGNVKSIRYSHVLNEKTKSCGCLNSENRKVNGKKNIKHNTYEYVDDYIKVWDTKHENYFLLSKADEDLILNHCWSKDFSSGGYWKASARKGGSKAIKLHQEIAKRIDDTYHPSKHIVPDHIGSSLVLNKEDENRREFIRIVSRSDNNKNHKTQSNNTSGKQGVGWCKAADKWIVRIYNNDGHRIHMLFTNFEDAVDKRIEWEKEYGYIGE